MIHGGSQLVNRLTRNNGQSQRWFWPNDMKNALSCVNVRMTNRVIEVLTEKRRDFGVEMIDLLVGTLNLGDEASMEPGMSHSPRPPKEIAARPSQTLEVITRRLRPSDLVDVGPHN
jgi:hypothetical protein